MSKTYNRIIAYGCSWTAGDELRDHEILEMKFHECNLLKKKLKLIDWWKLEYREKTIRQWINENVQQNRNASWAAHLATKLNLKFENRAVGGSSIEEHYYSIVRDISQKKINQDDLVVVGLTTMERLFFFKKEKPMSKLLTLNWQWDDLNFRNKLITEIYTDEFLVWNYYKNLILLKQLSDLINIRFQFMVSRTCIESLQFNYSTRDIDFFVKRVYDDIRPLLLVENKFLETRDDPRENPELCGHGHYAESHHIRLADSIIEKLEL